jgi:hypothetical protein
LIEEFGGAPFKGETIRQFVDRYIDAALTANAEVTGRADNAGTSGLSDVLGVLKSRRWRDGAGKEESE